MSWTTLSFPYGSILSSSKMTQLYDNITAQANGDTGAPKQQTLGIANNAVTAAKMNDVSASNTYSVATSLRPETSVSITATKIKEIICPVDGTLYSTFWLASATVSTYAYAQIYKNGTAVGTFHSTFSTGYLEKIDASISFVAGDLLQIYAYTGGGSAGAIVSSWKLRATTIPVAFVDNS